MSGPGTELKKILSWFAGAEACQNCADKAKIMDDKGVEWVEQNIETVIRWVVANSRRMCVSRLIPEAIKDAIARNLILTACSNAKTTKLEVRNITGRTHEQIQDTVNNDSTSVGNGLRSAARRCGEEQPSNSRESDPKPTTTNANQELGEQTPV